MKFFQNFQKKLSYLNFLQKNKNFNHALPMDFDTKIFFGNLINFAPSNTAITNKYNYNLFDTTRLYNECIVLKAGYSLMLNQWLYSILKNELILSEFVG